MKWGFFVSINEKKLNGIEDNTRRTFMKNSGLTLGGLIVGGAVGSLLGKKPMTKTEQASAPMMHEMAQNPNKALMFFTPDEFKVVEAAAEQIFPKTDVGPGAKELLVGYYIDHQMAGTFGNNSREYMTGPFYPGEATPELGYQTHLTRKEVMTLGIKALNDEAAKRFKSKFNELKEEQQIEILKDFEANKVNIKGAATSGFFFSLLRKVTIEGAYADPMYGGNKDMAGWKMKEFPGHQGSYVNVLDKDFQKIEPKALNSQHSM
ncbi:gluconate 2-dehydrogenase subunit 3 family protein [Bacillus sp. C11]|nr:gluconate 2-dehydrogenase subunit 3 family protein [Neobacillus terrae]